MARKRPRADSLGSDLAAGVETIGRGGVVAFPTETYYGLAVDPLNPAALARLFRIKHRDRTKPILTLIRDQEQLKLLVHDIPDIFKPLMPAFWPGPLTLIFRSRPELPDLLTGGTQTIGVRISSHPVAARLVAGFGRPITATSANISGQPAAVTAPEVRAQLGREVDLIIDGGPTPGGAGSTIVSAAGPDRLVLIRSGVIPFAELIAAG